MPRLASWCSIVAACVGAAACAVPQPEGPRPPLEIVSGRASSAVQAVESTVARAEVEAAVSALIAAAPICTGWPTLWLDRSERSSEFRARYDLMARDWGAELTQASRERMNEFVSMGYLAERSATADGVVLYVLTPAGRAAMRGSPYVQERPSFCSPAERRLVEIVSMEWIESDCGNLRVRFSHTWDDWPVWASAERTRRRLEPTWGAPGAIAEGRVTLSRQWFRADDLPRDVVNGRLWSVCVDPRQQRAVGDDLELFAAAS